MPTTSFARKFSFFLIITFNFFQILRKVMSIFHFWPPKILTSFFFLSEKNEKNKRYWTIEVKNRSIKHKKIHIVVKSIPAFIALLKIYKH